MLNTVVNLAKLKVKLPHTSRKSDRLVHPVLFYVMKHAFYQSETNPTPSYPGALSAPTTGFHYFFSRVHFSAVGPGV